jgi:hypothetical protein
VTSPASVRRPRRLGGLGCLGQLALLAVLGVAFVCAVDFVFAPWSYYLGGRMHVLPFWEGIGRMHSASGDYVLYVSLSPTPSGTSLHLPSVTGFGYLCTPKQERIVLRLGGGFHEKVGMDTDGKRMGFYLHRRPAWTWFGTWDPRPRLELQGQWNHADLELDDGGSLSRAFFPDGTLYTGPARNQPRERERVSLVLRETPWTYWFSDCRGEAR